MIEPNLVENNKYGNILNILHLVVFISFNILVINGIYKKNYKITNWKNNKKCYEFFG